MHLFKTAVRPFGAILARMASILGIIDAVHVKESVVDIELDIAIIMIMRVLHLDCTEFTLNKGVEKFQTDLMTTVA